MTKSGLKDTSVFSPIKVGNVTLSHRVAQLPTTRFRATEDGTPSNLQLQYYKDRSAFPGTLMITEATDASFKLGHYPNAPGIYTDRHTAAWKKIVDVVHANGSVIAVQLWALGRVAIPSVLKERNVPFTAPSAIYASDDSRQEAEKIGHELRSLTEEEIHDIIYNQYTNAAKKALEAGFDFIEIHSANSYMLEQFLHPSSNKRTDKYGGSIENRARLLLELIDHLLTFVPAEKLAVRFSPWNSHLGMLAENEEISPVVIYSYLASELQKRANAGNKLAYVSLVYGSRFQPDRNGLTYDNTFFLQIWKGVVLRGGQHSSSTDFSGLPAETDDGRTLVGFGRHFIANPDLVKRIEQGWELNEFDRTTSYGNSNEGYNTYQTYGDKSEVDIETARTQLAEALIAE
jgi:NADPH2 dehydrogenase